MPQLSLDRARRVVSRSRHRSGSFRAVRASVVEDDRWLLLLLPTTVLISDHPMHRALTWVGDNL
jgi:hypothetical protein